MDVFDLNSTQNQFFVRYGEASFNRSQSSASHSASEDSESDDSVSEVTSVSEPEEDETIVHNCMRAIASRLLNRNNIICKNLEHTKRPSSFNEQISSYSHCKTDISIVDIPGTFLHEANLSELINRTELQLNQSSIGSIRRNMTKGKSASSNAATNKEKSKSSGNAKIQADREGQGRVVLLDKVNSVQGTGGAVFDRDAETGMEIDSKLESEIVTEICLGLVKTPEINQQSVQSAQTMNSSIVGKKSSDKTLSNKKSLPSSKQDKSLSKKSNIPVKQIEPNKIANPPGKKGGPMPKMKSPKIASTVPPQSVSNKSSSRKAKISEEENPRSIDKKTSSETSSSTVLNEGDDYYPTPDLFSQKSQNEVAKLKDVSSHNEVKRETADQSELIKETSSHTEHVNKTPSYVEHVKETLSHTEHIREAPAFIEHIKETISHTITEKFNIDPDEENNTPPQSRSDPIQKSSHNKPVSMNKKKSNPSRSERNSKEPEIVIQAEGRLTSASSASPKERKSSLNFKNPLAVNTPSAVSTVSSKLYPTTDGSDIKESQDRGVKSRPNSPIGTGKGKPTTPKSTNLPKKAPVAHKSPSSPKSPKSQKTSPKSPNRSPVEYDAGNLYNYSRGSQSKRHEACIFNEQAFIEHEVNQYRSSSRTADGGAQEEGFKCFVFFLHIDTSEVDEALLPFRSSKWLWWANKHSARKATADGTEVEKRLKAQAIFQSVKDRRVFCIEKLLGIKITVDEKQMYTLKGNPCFMGTIFANAETQIVYALDCLEQYLPKFYKQVIFVDRLQKIISSNWPMEQRMLVRTGNENTTYLFVGYRRRRFLELSGFFKAKTFKYTNTKDEPYHYTQGNSLIARNFHGSGLLHQGFQAQLK